MLNNLYNLPAGLQAVGSPSPDLTQKQYLCALSVSVVKKNEPPAFARSTEFAEEDDSPRAGDDARRKGFSRFAAINEQEFNLFTVRLVESLQLTN